jgi:hypothetical protein
MSELDDIQTQDLRSLDANRAIDIAIRVSSSPTLDPVTLIRCRTCRLRHSDVSDPMAPHYLEAYLDRDAPIHDGSHDVPMLYRIPIIKPDINIEEFGFYLESRIHPEGSIYISDADDRLEPDCLCGCGEYEGKHKIIPYLPRDSYEHSDLIRGCRLHLESHIQKAT